MNKISKLLCAFALCALAVAMAAFLLPTQAQAATIDSGTCGDNLTWTLDDAGTLTISGTGAMRDYYYISPSAPWYSKRSGINTVVIGNGVTSIGDGAFYDCASLRSITIPDSVTSIGWSAFSSCDSLTSVTIPDSVTSIGSSAFYNCTSLKSITIPDSVTSIGSSAFYNCTSLTSVTIPDSVTGIGNEAFFSCDSLTSITIPDSVTSIGWCVFYYCTSLTSITIGDSVTSIGSYAFSNCTSLTSVTIGDSVTSIDSCAFSSCDSLTSVTIPDSVTSIGEDAFRNCDSLIDVYITDPNAWCKIDFDGSYANPMYYGDHLRILDSEGNEVTDVVLNDSVTTIPDDAFCRCTSLESITIPDSVTSIGNSAFDYCYWLSTVYYSGTQNQWSQISIGSYNSNLISATIHYNHIHDYTLFPVTTVEPTCTAAGYREYTCVYGETYRETTKPALGHNDEINGTVTAPTCNSQGYTTNICTRCGRTANTDFVAALGHDYSGITTVVEPKCAEKGYTLTQCIRCASTQKSSITDELGHKMVFVPAVPPTCTEPGLTAGSACERCGQVGVAQKEVAETGHNVINSACTNCGLCFPGDIDNSAGVDADDAIALLLHISMPDQFPLAAPADFNGDGEVDAADVVDLLLHICLPDIFPLQIAKKEN